MRPNFTRLIYLLVLIAGLLSWQTVATRQGRSSPPASVMAGALAPFQAGLGRSGQWFSDVGRVLVKRGDIRTENERLKLRVADLEGQNNRLLRYRRENDELRGLLKVPAPPSGRALAAEIIGFETTDFAQRVTLNVGSRQGVRPKDVVYCAYGLVGQVLVVTPLTSIVAMLTDRDSGVGAMSSRTLAKGVVIGSGERICKFSFLDFGADLREGDVVVTSGLVSGRGAIFPKGIVIGRVLKVERDKTYSRLEADVDTAVPFDRITSVFVRVNA